MQTAGALVAFRGPAAEPPQAYSLAGSRPAGFRLPAPLPFAMEMSLSTTF